MYTKDQLESSLKAQAKNAMFERDFMIAFNKHLNQKRSGQTYADQLSCEDWMKYKLKPVKQILTPFTIFGDDKF